MSYINRRKRVKALCKRLLPPPDENARKFDYSLLAVQEREEMSAFIGSLPQGGETDVKDLSNYQLDELKYWIWLENTLYEGKTEDADRRRRRHGLTLDELTDRFLNLDLSYLPTDCNVPGLQVQEDNVVYSYSYGNYRYIAMAIEMGRANRYKDDMYRWVDIVPRLRDLVHE